MARAPRSKSAKAAQPAQTTTAVATAEPTKGKAKQVTDDHAAASNTLVIDRHVSPAQALKAINALVAHRKKRTEAASASTDDLLPPTPTARDDAVFVQFALKRLAVPTSSNPFPKPVQIPLPHPLLSTATSAQGGGASVCLIVKDPQREYKDLLTSLHIRSIARVVGVTKLKGKFAPFEARRQLMNDHDLFLVDERVVGMMPRLLGKKWMESKKPPIPVKLTQTRHLATELDRAIGATYYQPTRGSCLTVRLGSLNAHTPSQLVDNLQAVIPAVVQRLKPIDAHDVVVAADKQGERNEGQNAAQNTRSRRNNVQSIELKTGSSMALPIWTSPLASRWVGMEEESAKAKEVREAKAAKRAAQVAKEEERRLKKRKGEKDGGKKGGGGGGSLLKGAQAVQAAMERESGDEDEDGMDDEDDDEEDVVVEGEDDDEDEDDDE